MAMTLTALASVIGAIGMIVTAIWTKKNGEAIDKGNKQAEILHNTVNGNMARQESATQAREDAIREMAVRLATVEAERQAAHNAAALAVKQATEASELAKSAAQYVARLEGRLLEAIPGPAQSPDVPTKVVIVNPSENPVPVHPVRHVPAADATQDPP